MTAMEDEDAEEGTEQQAGGAGRPTAHPTGAASAAAAGGPVSGARASQGGELNDARYSSAHFTGAAPAAPVGGPVRARPELSIGVTLRTGGGDVSTTP